MSGLPLLLWSVVPPLLVLAYYYYPVRIAPTLPRLLVLFGLGMLAGVVALGLQLGFEWLASQWLNWRGLTRSLPGSAFRQVVEISSIEEAAKLLTVLLATGRLRRRGWLVPAPVSTVLLSTTAVAMGFAAEENAVYLYHDTAPLIDRIVGTPGHIWFSASWGYALALPVYQLNQFSRRSHRYSLIFAWFNAVICHALVNILSSTWGYPWPWRFLSNGVFPLLLWLAWRMDRLWRLSQGKPVPPLITGRSFKAQLWQRSLALFALFLGGNTLFNLFLIGRQLSSLSADPLLWQMNRAFWLMLLQGVLHLSLGFVALGVYRYLRQERSRYNGSE